MLLLLDLMLTIVSAICAVFLLLLGIVLVLGKGPLRWIEQTGVRRKFFSIPAVANPVKLPPEATASGSRDIRPTLFTPQLSTGPTQLSVPRSGTTAATVSPAPPPPLSSQPRWSLLPAPPPPPPPSLAKAGPTTDSFAANPPKAQRYPTGDIAPPEMPPDSSSAQSSALLQIQEKLLIQLLRLLEGDVERRDWLIQQAQQNYPAQSDLWCLEKVIQDLAGDRGR